MANVPVNFRNLAELDDGRLSKQFDGYLKAAINDCRMRPTDDRKRTIKLEIELVPILEDGDFNGADLEYHITSKTPNHKGNRIKTITRKIKNDWTLVMPTEGNDASQGQLGFDKD